MRKKAQLQIMENMFILLIVFIILIVAFVVVIGFNRAEQVQKANDFKELEMVKKAQVINFLPEMQCSDNNNINPDCYDLLKIEAFKEKLGSDKLYYSQMLGNVKITIKRLDPSSANPTWTDETVIYDNPPGDYEGIRPIRFPVLLRDVVDDSNYFGVVELGVYE